ncbi:peptide ABC transporter substrate-binding protein [Synoicihabitans lomoniglobus]|uniref:Peptide ABC transporter substrate-binding protein n=1 Tax=Synoicihabitans lomoniglobus TaxID=2909285 RepID=A0AAE9ZV97_9BACT|nr:peptide ABC transporter substrate-binding protein [Opitutaceae bacterium LMO-M01]WED63759.1 peptide ABC transporter substrate-binding protein [Opitutaceae bacterium LMO-M01]
MSSPHVFRSLGSWRTVLTAAVALMFFLTACGRTERMVDTGVREGVLHLGNGAEPPDLDPHVVTGVPEFHIIDALFEGLVSINPETRQPAPGVAERWEVSADGTVYTFHFWPGLKWSDGTALTAADFVRTYERIMNPALGSEYTYLFEILEGGPAYITGESTDFSTVGVIAHDARTLEIRLRHPVPYFLSLLTYTCWRPLPIHVIERFDGLRRRGTEWTREGNLVGNGSFRLKTWSQNRVIVVERNPYYWDAATVSLNAIHFHPVESVDTEERMFRSGQLHKTNDIPSAKMPTYAEMADSPLRVDPQLGTYYYRMNVTRPPLDDARVRLAMSLAIDREAIVTHVTRRGETAAGSFSPPGMGGFVPAKTVAFDPDKARALLAEAGYPNGVGFPGAELLYNTSENHRAVAEAIQQMWRRELGIDVQLFNQEWKVYLDSMTNLDYGLARSGWVAVYDDANQFVEIMTTGNPNNRTGWGDPAYDRLHAASMAEQNPAKRAAMIQQLDAMLIEGGPIAPVYHYTRAYLLDPRVKGWWPNPLDKHPYKHVRLVDAP